MRVGDLAKVLVRGNEYIHVITKIEKRRNIYGTHDKYAVLYGTPYGAPHWHPEHTVEILSAN